MGLGNEHRAVCCRNGMELSLQPVEPGSESGSDRIGILLPDPEPSPRPADPDQDRDPDSDPYPFQPNVKLNSTFFPTVQYCTVLYKI
jgi:hypothetical protein